MANETAALIQVEVIFAHPDGVWRRKLALPPGSSAQQALRHSGLLTDHPGLGDTPPMGIFGRSCPPRQALQCGDRLEIYRPLVFDPMESRRRRAQHRQRKKTLSGA